MDVERLSKDEWEELGNAPVNGRQIKNAVKSCQGLARHHGQPMSFGHVRQVLQVMKEFEEVFNDEDGGVEI